MSFTLLAEVSLLSTRCMPVTNQFLTFTIRTQKGDCNQFSFLLLTFLMVSILPNQPLGVHYPKFQQSADALRRAVDHKVVTEAFDKQADRINKIFSSSRRKG